MKIPSSLSQRCFASVLISLIFSWGLRVHRCHVVRHRSVFTSLKEIELRMRHIRANPIKPGSLNSISWQNTFPYARHTVFRFVPLGIGTRDLVIFPRRAQTANKKKKFLLEIKTTRIPLTADSVDSGIIAKWTTEDERECPHFNRLRGVTGLI